MHGGDFLRTDRLPDFSEGPADESLVETLEQVRPITG
jgi:hypothetical protein